MKKCRGLQDYVNGYNYFYNNYRITYYMSNIEPLLDAVDTLLEYIWILDSSDEQDDLWGSTLAQADYIAGMIAMYRAMNKTPPPIMKPTIDRMTTTDTYRDSGGQKTYTTTKDTLYNMNVLTEIK
ncbi:MAG: hypothetical protein BWY93_01642 [Euryarchaeota archaeon ADurb.BinA087]|nr:MAG: hypothetical protein BWY93_01642 [Euryarchaeota archaeon ADurb.BinA087]